MREADSRDEGLRQAIVSVLPRLRRFCQAMTGNPSDGDDLMQSTVTRALARGHQFEAGTRIDSWMYRIAQNIHIDGARSARRRGTAVGVELLDSLVGNDGRVLTEDRSDIAAARQALQALPEDQRAVFLLVVVDGRSYREAAEALDVPVGTVMSRLARARERIAGVLGQTRGVA